MQNFAPELNSSLTNSKPNSGQILQNLQSINNITQMLQMNHFARLDRSVFIKNLLGLPQNLSQVLYQAQNFDKPLVGGTLGMNNLNSNLM